VFTWINNQTNEVRYILRSLLLTSVFYYNIYFNHALHLQANIFINFLCIITRYIQIHASKHIVFLDFISSVTQKVTYSIHVYVYIWVCIFLLMDTCFQSFATMISAIMNMKGIYNRPCVQVHL
jgi:hypothetical protein